MKPFRHLILLLFIVPVLLVSPNGMVRVRGSTTHGYKPHFPIYITRDIDFEYLGFPGSGSPDDPYILERLEITGYDSAIQIEETSASFIIRNCILGGSSRDLGSIVALQRVGGFALQDCDIFTGYNGLRLIDCWNSDITGNRIYDCHNGIDISIIRKGNVSSNTIFGNNVGMNFGGTSSLSHCSFTHNRVYGNTGRGIDIQAGWNNTFYSNRIGWNGGTIWPNVRDSGLNNTWDDGVSQGNFWDDYVGYGDYDIPGDADFVDRFPSLLTDEATPTIDDPDDIQIEQGDREAELVWIPSDEYPHEFIINMNGDLLDMGVWNGKQINVPLKELDIGVYNFSLRVKDAEGIEASDNVLVQVIQPIFGISTDPVLPFVVVGAIALIVILIILRRKWM